MNRSLLRALLLVALLLACFALSPQARATCQDGCLTNDNTVLGDDALLSNTSSDNTAIGFNALFSNTTGLSNTAVGSQALFSNQNGLYNTAVGVDALTNNTFGGENTAVGYQALMNPATSSWNTAVGYLALQNGGGQDTAVGYLSMMNTTTGDLNTAIGAWSLNFNTTGRSNTALGWRALFFNTTGSNNIAIGLNAGSSNTTGSNNIDIGNHGDGNGFNTIRIGQVGIQTNTYIAGISGVTVASGVGVIIDGRGHLGTVVSSERFKDEIKPMNKASEAILALKPVTFRYKHELDSDGIPQFGLVAEEVEKVNPDLVARDEQGKPYTVRYEAVNAMLLNEFLKARRQIDAQQKQIDALTAGLQKVSAQLAVSRPTPQTVANNQ